MDALTRFLRYAVLDTRSDPTSAAVPSSAGQLAMLRLLGDELRALGAAEVELRNRAYLTATIPANHTPQPSPVDDAERLDPVVGFLAHVDTSPDVSGANVKPCVSGDWVTSDGTTLLGADDKAGVAAIMTAAEQLLRPDAPPHGRIRLAFTTDEEIGRGTERFDIRHFNADFAYTVDGGSLGELQFENFNAAQARISIDGVSAHPGDAHGKMVNALGIALKIDASLPADERPETTSDRQGFYHLTSLFGTVEHAECEYLVRDFDRVNFETRKRLLAEIVDRHPQARITITDQYLNMSERLKAHPQVVERARRAMLKCGVQSVERPVRGGTDGARLTEMGLPCPNIFTGGENFHSTAERLHIPSLEKCTRVIVEIASISQRGVDVAPQIPTESVPSNHSGRNSPTLCTL